MIYFHQLVNGLITVFIVSSTLLIVVMAAERYIAVCHPLRARNLISLRRTRTSITLVFVVCAIATIPIFFEQGIEEMLCDDGRTVLHLVDRQWMKKRRIIWAILFDFIPCVALVYFNLCLIIQIRRAKKLRDEMTPKHSIIRYNSQGLKSTSLRTNPPHLTTFNKKTNGLYVKRSRVKRQPTEPSYILETPDSQCPENGVEVKKYSKLNALGRGDNLKLTEPPSRSLCSESTDNEFQALNDVPKTAPRQGQTGNAVKLRNIETNVGRKRPSDSALNSVTATLVAVVLLFLILVSPSELLKFSMEYTNASHAQMGVVKAVTNFMQVLNFSLNFVLYCAVNKTFRHTLHGLICCCWLSVRG
ncbi:uncharacterized protein LOC131947641 [Physella acuta]|uniref:uncharacterized protein LOC131947641 n=1 Tax=Physella acuta TaxID=109671 RepID=UPI0027DC2D40|nr:uncharacterized protein LOC131947641 [Physella acuta]